MGWATNYINELKGGKTISFRPRGNSMVGRCNFLKIKNIALYERYLSLQTSLWWISTHRLVGLLFLYGLS